MHTRHENRLGQIKSIYQDKSNINLTIFPTPQKVSQTQDNLMLTDGDVDTPTGGIVSVASVKEGSLGEEEEEDAEEF